MLAKLARTLAAIACLTLLSICWIGCETTDEMTTQPATQPMAMVSPGALSLCSGCGEIKGTADCCDPNAPTCSGCDLAKSSPGCCKMVKGGEPLSLCANCGHIKGTELCCAPDQTRCTGCGLVKGSAGCCKIN